MKRLLRVWFTEVLKEIPRYVGILLVFYGLIYWWGVQKKSTKIIWENALWEIVSAIPDTTGKVSWKRWLSPVENPLVLELDTLRKWLKEEASPRYENLTTRLPDSGVAFIRTLALSSIICHWLKEDSSAVHRIGWNQAPEGPTQPLDTLGLGWVLNAVASDSTHSVDTTLLRAVFLNLTKKRSYKNWRASILEDTITTVESMIWVNPALHLSDIAFPDRSILRSLCNGAKEFSAFTRWTQSIQLEEGSLTYEEFINSVWEAFKNFGDFWASVFITFILLWAPLTAILLIGEFWFLKKFMDPKPSPGKRLLDLLIFLMTLPTLLWVLIGYSLHLGEGLGVAVLLLFLGSGLAYEIFSQTRALGTQELTKPYFRLLLSTDSAPHKSRLIMRYTLSLHNTHLLLRRGAYLVDSLLLILLGIHVNNRYLITRSLPHNIQGNLALQSSLAVFTTAFVVLLFLFHAVGLFLHLKIRQRGGLL